MKTICFDFDGVIHKYSKGWCNGDCYDKPVKGALLFIRDLMDDGYAVVVLSTRNPLDIQNWFHKYSVLRTTVIPEGVAFWEDNTCIAITNRKLPALVYIDDRGLKFEGKFDKAFMDAIFNFKTWQQQ